ncbi:DUF4190 domain-containing protein [Polymorphospora rubra]|uniref:DUF4190 domain-containing protein n=1 Tax=Polymorphospora rubra TaxID=338584 RepID=UPI0033F38DA4
MQPGYPGQDPYGKQPQDPNAPQYQDPYAQPQQPYGQPTSGQPYGQPTSGQPAYGQPVSGDPYGQPTSGQPAYGQPVSGDPYGQPSYQDPYAQQQPTSGQPYGAAPGYPAASYGAPASSQNNTLGLIGMIVGIVALPLAFCCGLFSLPFGIGAIVLGFLGKNKADQGQASNRGQAMAALICGASSIVLAIIMVIVGQMIDLGPSFT